MNDSIRIDVFSIYGRHVSEHVARDDVQAVTELGDAELRESSAVTIASWWQAPSGTGYVLAGFASGATVSRQELLDDIASTRATEEMSDEDKRALDCLSTFVIHYTETEI